MPAFLQEAYKLTEEATQKNNEMEFLHEAAICNIKLTLKMMMEISLEMRMMMKIWKI